MANIQSKSERAKARRAYLKMRSDHRASLVEKPIEFDPDDFVDDGKTILHGPRLRDSKKLTVKIPRWTGTPPIGNTRGDFLTLQLDKGDGNGFVDVASHRFLVPDGQTDFLEAFPYEMEISINDFPEHANCQLKYRVDYYNNSDDESDPVPFLCDRLQPYGGHVPEALKVANPHLDDVNLPANGKLALTFAESANYRWKDNDRIHIYLFNVNDIPEPEDLKNFQPIESADVPDPGLAPVIFDIDAQKIRALGDAKAVFLYVIRDTALNDSLVSLWTNVILTWGPLPAEPLDKPEVDQADPVLLLEDVLEGVSVWIKRPAAYKAGDALAVKWGNTEVVEDFPIPDNGSERIEVPVVPAKTLLLEYGKDTVGVKSTRVSYTYFRKGRPFGPASDMFDVNLESPIGWLPWPPLDEWPEPWHPSLLKGTVKNHDDTRTNKLTRADKNEDAFFDFKWPLGAKDGLIVTPEWNGQRVLEARRPFDSAAGDTPGGNARTVIPWSYIKDGKNGPNVPVRYWASKTGLDNELPSEITEVDVNAIATELPQPNFPTVPGDYPNCTMLEANGDLQFELPDLTGLVPDGQTIKVKFIPMTGEYLTDPEAPILGAEFEKDYVLGTDGPVTGLKGLVTPYDTHIKPLYDQTAATHRRGRMKLIYFWYDGFEDIPSESLTRITAFHDGSGSCPIPRP
ncbi:hypothetical protein [Pseudomonas sp. C2B4]|uniref:hypothetical protein n=1 Tax=Pseudomonas sp. C2B4 TaxID=2735270 RepID=UPI0015862DB6|nr:hypothetical protein [Pseudomonas sp. C2B4]NUU37290.1 hypothetical protein [Pseudomonas sp. C2B4]